MPSSRLGRARNHSTSRSATSTPPASRAWAACSWCAPLVPSGPPVLIGPCSPCTPVRLRRNQPTCTLFRLPARTSLRIVRPPLTRQLALAFNQPLSSFNTSKVKRMRYMFAVRPARALAPHALSRAFPVHAACAAVAPHTPCCLRASPDRIVCPPLDSRQYARSFDQPLSNFDTSTVTDMGYMFNVRSARALHGPPSLESDPAPRAHRSACAATNPHAHS
jgi:surface protein